MGLAGRSTDILEHWDTHEIYDDFTGTDPVLSGFILSGVQQGALWLTGPSTATNVQCSGVTATNLSGQPFGQVALGSPATAGAEGAMFSRYQNLTVVSGGTLYTRFRVRPDEITTSGALQLGVGLVSAPSQSGIVSPTGGAWRSSGNHFIVGKLSGQQNWNMMANVQTSGVSVPCTANCGGNQSGQFYDVELFLNPDRGTVQFTAKVNGVFLKQAGLSPLSFTQPAVITLPVDGNAMSLYAGIRQGAGEAATITLDKAYAQQTNNYP